LNIRYKAAISIGKVGGKYPKTSVASSKYAFTSLNVAPFFSIVALAFQNVALAFSNVALAF
jgi:hypothetical protein